MSNEDYKTITALHIEQVHLIIGKHASSVNPEEWCGVPNEFVSLCIPDKFNKFIKGVVGRSGNLRQETVTTEIISALILCGISALHEKLTAQEGVTEQLNLNEILSKLISRSKDVQ